MVRSSTKRDAGKITPYWGDGTPGFGLGINYADSLYSFTRLLLHCNGTNGSTTFTNNASSVISVSSVANGGAAPSVSTAGPKLGTGAAAFAANGWLLSGSSVLTPSTTADFCLEMFVKPASFGTPMGLFGISSAKGFVMWINASGNIVVGAQTTNASIAPVALLTSSIALTAGVWTHVAVVRGSGYLYIYIGGVERGFVSNSTSFFASACVIGAARTAGSYMYKYTGLIDEVRLTANARYTAAFTPPTEEFPG